MNDEYLSRYDVMLGDWVDECTDTGDHVWYTKVGLGLTERMLFGKSLCKPIGITEKFLERNGFVRKGVSSYYVSEDGRIIMDGSLPNYPRKWYVHVDNEDFESIGSCDLDYVHQLQQFLNICGIEKEFKL